MIDEDTLIEPLVRKNRGLRRKLEAWIELLDAAGLAAVCAVESGKILSNPSARRFFAGCGQPNLFPNAVIEALEASGNGCDIILRENGVCVWRCPNTAPAPRARLTKRERLVASWLRQGKTASEIAVIIGISPRTVEKHIENLYTKLRVRDFAGFLKVCEWF